MDVSLTGSSATVESAFQRAGSVMELWTVVTTPMNETAQVCRVAYTVICCSLN